MLAPSSVVCTMGFVCDNHAACCYVVHDPQHVPFPTQVWLEQTGILFQCSFEAIEDVLHTEIIPDKALRRQNTGARKIQSNAITNLNKPRHRTDTNEKTQASSVDPVPINQIKSCRPPASKIDTLLREYLERRGSSELEDSAGRLESKVVEEVWDQVEKSPIVSGPKKRTGKSLMQVKNEQDAAIRALCHQ